MDKHLNVGIYIIEILTLGMYPDELSVIREYIQNSTDSITTAVDQGILGDSEGRVTIHMDDTKKSITISDNGTGINPELAVDILTSIGDSNKDGESTAGFRGIGRLAGIAYCDQLSFKTSNRGSNKYITVHFDCKTIRHLIKNHRITKSHIDDMVNCIMVDEGKEDSNNHYFDVVMTGVDNEGFFNLDSLMNYIGIVGPVPMSEKFVYSQKLHSELFNVYHINEFQIVLNGNSFQRQIYREFRTVYGMKRGKAQGSIYDIDGVLVNVVSIGDHSKVAYWLSESDLRGQICDQYAGLRLRHHNIAIGDVDTLETLWKQIMLTNPSDSRFLKYFIGDIHIISNNVVPNARRDMFEDNQCWREIVEIAIKPLFEDITRKVRTASKEHEDPEKKIEKEVRALIGQGSGFSSHSAVLPDDKRDYLKQVEKAKAKAKAVQDEREFPNPRIQIVVDDLDKVASTVAEIKDPYIGLDRKLRKVVDRILKALGGVLDSENYELAKGVILDELTNPNAKVDL